MSNIRVLVADDHAIVREGAKQILMAQPDMEMVGEAENGEDALDVARKTHPDVIVLDISMPGLTGLDVIPILRRALPQTKLVVLSIHHKEAFVRQVLRAGAMGYVLKTAPISDLLAAIRAATRSQHYLSPKIESDVITAYAKHGDPDFPDKNYDALSEREQQVFRLVVDGKSNKQIGELLHLSPRTVEKHRASILRKLGLNDTREMIKYAIKLGILDTDE
jgi:two-component system response regulator NreC